MSHTAWTKPSPQRSHGGSRNTYRSPGLTSDFLVPRGGSSKTGKGRDQSRSPREPKKSRDVRKLENLIAAVDVVSYESKHIKEGCFCRARKHDLSRYVPLCIHCGLILCKLQHPALPCPSCHSSLFLQPSSRQTVMTKLRSELEAILKAEEETREKERAAQLQREIEAAGGGAFPVLPPSSSPALAYSTPQSRKVLSLNSKTKKVTLSTISRTSASPAHSGPSAAELAAEEEELEDVVSREERTTRVPPPSAVTEHAQRKGAERRWEPVRGGGAVYVPAPQEPTAGNENVSSGSGKKSRKGKGKKTQAPNTAALPVENVDLSLNYVESKRDRAESNLIVAISQPKNRRDLVGQLSQIVPPDEQPTDRCRHTKREAFMSICHNACLPDMDNDISSEFCELLSIIFRYL